jgi:hypothetical protein
MPELLDQLPVSREVVLPAEPVVIDPGNMGHAGIDRRCLVTHRGPSLVPNTGRGPARMIRGTPDPRPTVSQQAPGDLVKPARLLVPDGRASPLPGLPRRATFCLLSAYLYAKEDD